MMNGMIGEENMIQTSYNSRLLESIDEKRIEMYEIAEEFGMYSQEVLEISLVLDQLIMEYMIEKDGINSHKTVVTSSSRQK